MKAGFIIQRQGKEFVLYEGLLDQAHEEGLKRITTTLIQIPHESNGNMAVVQAEVETSRGVYSGIGDASPANVNRMIIPHILRMAETRAKARALRDAINIGMTSIEEMGDGTVDPDKDGPTAPKEDRAQKTKPHNTQSSANGKGTRANDDDDDGFVEEVANTLLKVQPLPEPTSHELALDKIREPLATLRKKIRPAIAYPDLVRLILDDLEFKDVENVTQLSVGELGLVYDDIVKRIKDIR